MQKLGAKAPPLAQTRSAAVVTRPRTSCESIVPLLTPSDGVPFACFLTLHSLPPAPSPDQEASASTDQRPPPRATAHEDILELVYVLAGSAQIRQTTGQDALQLHAGDSVAVSASAATVEATDTERHRPAEWRLATLHLVFDAGDQGTVAGKRDVIQSALDSRLAAPSTSRISAARSAAIAQCMAIAPQNEATEEAADSPISSTEEGRSSSSRRQAGSSQKGGQYEQSPLLPALLRSRAAVQRFFRRLSSWQRWERRGVMPRRLCELDPVQLPDQTNKLALAFSPLQSPAVSFCLGLEVFQPAHVTTPHTHHGAWEVFFIISGSGTGHCDGSRFPVEPGDAVAFPPGSAHGIDNADDARMYTVEVMLPAGGLDAADFAAFVQAGVTASFSDDDMTALLAPRGAAD